MYTKGSSALYIALDKNKLSEFFTVANTSSGKEVETEMAKAEYARRLAEQYDAKQQQIADLQAKITAEKKAAEQCNKDADKADKEKKEQEKSNDGSTPSPEAEKTPAADTPKTTTPTNTQQENTNNDGSTIDPAAKRKEAKQHTDNAQKYRQQIKELRNLHT